MLVADSVQGLTYDRVSVVLFAAEHPAASPTMPPSPVGLGAMTLAALAGGLAVCGFGAFLFALRVSLRPLRKIIASRRLDKNVVPAADTLPESLS
jgi:type III secretory pathway lipoprotein EscJ